MVRELGKGVVYCSDGSGCSSGVPQLSSQSATSRRGIITPDAARARASAMARVRASSSVGSSVLADAAIAPFSQRYTKMHA